MNAEAKSNWFNQHPRISTVIVLILAVFFVEGLMHLLYWTNLLPVNTIYMTQLEKVGYRKNVNQITYEDGIPRRAMGLATYIQRGIPNQYIEFDDQGMRLDAYQGDTGHDVFIGVFGDSYVDALQVGQYDVFSARAEAQLRADGCNADLRNYGLGATGTSAQYLRYRQLKQNGHHFDHVIVTMFLGNDILNNHPKLDALDRKYSQYPYLVIQGEQLVRHDTETPARGRGKAWSKARIFFRDYSHLINTVYNLHTVFTAQLRMRDSGGEHDRLTHARPSLGMFNVYNPNPDDDWKLAWATTEAIVDSWHKEATAADEKFLLIFLTESIQISPDYKNPLNLDLDYPNRRMSRFAAANHIDYIDFLPHARARVRQDRLEFPYLSWEHDGHYSPVGHAILADALVVHLENKLNCGHKTAKTGRHLP
jgi:hypothetical protein